MWNKGCSIIEGSFNFGFRYFAETAQRKERMKGCSSPKVRSSILLYMMAEDLRCTILGITLTLVHSAALHHTPLQPCAALLAALQPRPDCGGQVLPVGDCLVLLAEVLLAGGGLLAGAPHLDHQLVLCSGLGPGQVVACSPGSSCRRGRPPPWGCPSSPRRTPTPASGTPPGRFLGQVVVKKNMR